MISAAAQLLNDIFGALMAIKLRDMSILIIMARVASPQVRTLAKITTLHTRVRVDIAVHSLHTVEPS